MQPVFRRPRQPPALAQDAGGAGAIAILLVMGTIAAAGLREQDQNFQTRRTSSSSLHIFSTEPQAHTATKALLNAGRSSGSIRIPHEELAKIIKEY